MGKQHENENEKKKKKKKKKRKHKTNLTILTESLHYCTLLSKEFLLFSTMSISIEIVTLIRITIAVCLMIPFAVHAFEDMRAGLTFFGGCSIYFLVIYAIPCFLSVMFGVVSSIAFSIPRDMRVTTKCRMTPFPAVLTLWNT